MKNMLSRPVDGEGRRLQYCLFSTFLLGLIAHGYGFLNLTISHDSVNEFFLSQSAPWKISLGRFMEPALRYLMGEIITLPWLTGLTGLLFIGLAVHFMSKMFSLDTLWENVLLSGVCVTTVTVTAVAATYIHDFAGDMLALLLCAAAAWCWGQMKAGFSWKFTLVGGVCLGLSFGFYQSYLAVTITLMAIRSLMDLLEGDKARAVLARLLRAAPMGILGAALYAVCVALSLKLFGLQLDGDEGNNLSYMFRHLGQLAVLVKNGYITVIADLIGPNKGTAQGVTPLAAWTVCILNGAAFVLSAFAVLNQFRKKAMRWQEILLSLCLAAILPGCMVCVGFISTVFHHLTQYAVCLYYLILLALLHLCPREGRLFRLRRALTIVLMCLVILSNIQLSNTAYVKKDLERQSTLSVMTRVLDRLEQYEDYVYGESTVAIMGRSGMHGNPLPTDAVNILTGLGHTSQIPTRIALTTYFDVVLQYPIHIATGSQEAQLLQTEAYAAMGVFPAADSIATIDGIIVVKLAEKTG